MTAIIESDWMTMSFTMNWKITSPGTVRFDLGEPLFQVIPLVSNLCKDMERAVVTYQKLAANPDVANEYRSWHESRKKYHQQKAAGDVRPDGWQKDYFRGVDPAGRPSAHGHTTKVTSPVIDYRSPKP